MAASHCMGGLRVTTWELCAAGWPGLLSSHPPDAVLSILLEDDRIPGVLEAIDQEICEELQWLASWPIEVWLAFTVGMSLDEGMQLRHGCMSSAAVAAAYIQSGLCHARRHPWSLCKGNVDENLSKLAVGEGPTEETAKQVRASGKRCQRFGGRCPQYRTMGDVFGWNRWRRPFCRLKQVNVYNASQHITSRHDTSQHNRTQHQF